MVAASLKRVIVAGAAGFFGVTAATAAATTVHLKGQVGFIGEWVFTADLGATTTPVSGATPPYSGSLTLRHVGLCTAHGPEEQAGQITAASLHAQAVKGLTLSYGSEACVYSGPLSAEAIGILRCKGGTEVPIRVWIEP